MRNILFGVSIIMALFGLAGFILYVTRTKESHEPYEPSRILKSGKIQPDIFIPKHIYMTYNNKSKIPPKVFKALQQFAIYDNKPIPYSIYDDNDCLKFIKKYFNKSIVNVWFRLKIGAHKADLFRYCILYIKGGIYLDIKTKLIKPLDQIFDLNQNILYTVLPLSHPASIYQGVLLSPRGNNIFLDLIRQISKTKNSKLRDEYQTITIMTKQIITKYSISGKLSAGPNKLLNNDMSCYLLTESCTNATTNEIGDKYGYSCKIYDRDRHVLDTRYNDFGKDW